MKEWYLEVPLEFQILLSNLFLNKDSLRRLDDSDNYLYNRIWKLYSLLDCGLNIFNRKYNGILQQLNTDTSSYIAENQKRKEVSVLLNGEIVKLNNITHTYDGFTKSVREYQEYILTRKCINIIIECINVMCTNHTHGMHVFVALEKEETLSDLQIFEDYATIIRSDLHKTHGVTVPEVIFLQTLYRWLVPQVSSSR